MLVDLIKEHLNFLKVKYTMTRETDTEFTFHLDQISKNKINSLLETLINNGFVVTFNNNSYIVLMDRDGQRISFMIDDNDLLYKIRVYTTLNSKQYIVKVHRIRSVNVRYSDDVWERNNIIVTVKISSKIKDLLISYSHKIGKSAGELIRHTLASTVLSSTGFDTDYNDKNLIDGDISVLSLKMSRKLLDNLDKFAINHKVKRSEVIRYTVYLILKNAGVF